MVAYFHPLVAQAFQSFINVNPKAQEYTSLFIDDNLKKGLKGVSLIQSRQASF